MSDLDLLLVAARNARMRVEFSGGMWRVGIGRVQVAAGRTPDRCLRELARRVLS